jgi:hypothetical protein
MSLAGIDDLTTITYPVPNRNRCAGFGGDHSIAKTASCQAAHLGYFVSGRMAVVMDDSEQMEFGPGDFAVMAPGHAAWIVGDEPCVLIDWQGFADYAKR